ATSQAIRGSPDEALGLLLTQAPTFPWTQNGKRPVCMSDEELEASIRESVAELMRRASAPSQRCIMPAVGRIDASHRCGVLSIEVTVESDLDEEGYSITPDREHMAMAELWERAITDLVEIERREDEENVTTAIIRAALEASHSCRSCLLVSHSLIVPTLHS